VDGSVLHTSSQEAGSHLLGVLVVSPKERKIHLLASDGIIVDTRQFSPSECIRSGSEIRFACHLAKFYDRLILRGQKLLVHDSLLEMKLSADHDRIVELNRIDPSSMAVHASHVLNLDFPHDVSFAKEIRSLFQSSGHPLIGSDYFTMVVSFGHASFRLDEDMVSLALEVAIGGHFGDLKVSLIADRVYSFIVSSKVVGFDIIKLWDYECFQFKCFFHLWGYGGPKWHREFSLWQKECNAQWQFVSHNNIRRKQRFVPRRNVITATVKHIVHQPSVPLPIASTKRVILPRHIVDNLGGISIPFGSFNQINSVPH
jgi:hypothetical protein